MCTERNAAAPIVCEYPDSDGNVVIRQGDQVITVLGDAFDFWLCSIIHQWNDGVRRVEFDQMSDLMACEGES